MEINVAGLVNLAGAGVGLILGIYGVTTLVLRGIRKIINDSLDPLKATVKEMQTSVDLITHEVNLNHGQSLKDGVRLIAEHLGIEFKPRRLEMKIKSIEEIEDEVKGTGYEDRG